MAGRSAPTSGCILLEWKELPDIFGTNPDIDADQERPTGKSEVRHHGRMARSARGARTPLIADEVVDPSDGSSRAPGDVTLRYK
jgi:hypothetical protein